MIIFYEHKHTHIQTRSEKKIGRERESERRILYYFSPLFYLVKAIIIKYIWSFCFKEQENEEDKNPRDPVISHLRNDLVFHTHSHTHIYI